jgi:type IV secretion system protein VirB11
MTGTSTRLSELLVTALGPGIAELLRDPEISEIRLNSDGTIWGNRLGFGKFQTDVRISVENAKRAIYAVAYGIGDVCNESKPSISAELPGTKASCPHWRNLHSLSFGRRPQRFLRLGT